MVSFIAKIGYIWGVSKADFGKYAPENSSLSCSASTEGVSGIAARLGEISRNGKIVVSFIANLGDMFRRTVPY